MPRQNVLLKAVALDLVAVPIGAFDDRRLAAHAATAERPCTSSRSVTTLASRASRRVGEPPV
jgi:hypothetical protein